MFRCDLQRKTYGAETIDYENKSVKTSKIKQNLRDDFQARMKGEAYVPNALSLTHLGSAMA